LLVDCRCYIVMHIRHLKQQSDKTILGILSQLMCGEHQPKIA
jgi:hypothetical protein